MKKVICCILLAAVLLLAVRSIEAHQHVLYGANGDRAFGGVYAFAGGRDDLTHVGMTNAGDPTDGSLVADPPMLALAVERNDGGVTHPPTGTERNMWEQGFKDMTPNVIFHSASLHDSQLFVYGGLDNEGTVLPNFRKFDMVNHRWYDIETVTEADTVACAALNCTDPGPLFGHCSVTDGTYLYLIGGQSSTASWTNEANFFWIALDNLESGWRSRASMGVDAIPDLLVQAPHLETIYSTCFGFEDVSGDHVAYVAGGRSETAATSAAFFYDLESLRTADTTISASSLPLPQAMFGAAGDVWNPSLSAGPPVPGTCSANLFVIIGGFNNESQPLNSSNSNANVILVDFLAGSYAACQSNVFMHELPSHANGGFYQKPKPRGFHSVFEFESMLHLAGGASTPNDAPFVPDLDSTVEDIAFTPYCDLWYLKALNTTSVPGGSYELSWNFNSNDESTSSVIDIDDSRFIRWPLGNNDGRRADLSRTSSGIISTP